MWGVKCLCKICMNDLFHANTSRKLQLHLIICMELLVCNCMLGMSAARRRSCQQLHLHVSLTEGRLLSMLVNPVFHAAGMHLSSDLLPGAKDPLKLSNTSSKRFLIMFSGVQMQSKTMHVCCIWQIPSAALSVGISSSIMDRLEAMAKERLCKHAPFAHSRMPSIHIRLL